MELQSLDVLRQVAEFHETFRHPVEPEPIIPDASRCALRVSLLEEELNELKQAIEQEDLRGISDALCDLQYVLTGAVLEFGLGAKFRALFDEVQRSNMSKTCATIEEAEETVAYYRESRGVEAHVEPSGNHYLVYRTSDRKTLKSVRYSPPDLASILGIAGQ